MALLRMAANQVLPEGIPRLGTNLANQAAVNQLPPLDPLKAAANQLPRVELPRVETSPVSRAVVGQLLRTAPPRMAANPAAHPKAGISPANKVARPRLVVSPALKMAAGLAHKAAVRPIPVVR
jgi:hypothetical protein